MSLIITVKVLLSENIMSYQGMVIRTAFMQQTAEKNVELALLIELKINCDIAPILQKL
jgi:hypothetical protein